jgi:hypothetical protein
MRNRFGNREVLCDSIGGVNSSAGDFSVNNFASKVVTQVPGAEAIGKIGELMNIPKSQSAVIGDAARQFSS